MQQNLSTSSEIEPDSHNTPNLEPQTQVKTDSQLKIIVAALSAVIVVMIGMIIFLYNQVSELSDIRKIDQPYMPSAETNPQGTTPDHPSSPMSQVSNATINLNKETHQLTVTTSDETILVNQHGLGITRAALSPDKTMVAFITGDIKSNDNGYSWVEPNSVKLFNLLTQDTTEIKSMPYRTIQNSDYPYRLVDVAFSNDNQTLAITTNDSLYFYTMNSAAEEIIFSNPQQQPRPEVYFYSTMQFSPDDSYLVLLEGYYESASYLLIDLTTNKTQNLGNQFDNRFFCWTSDNEYIIQKDVNHELYSNSTVPVYSRFERVNLVSNSSVELAETDDPTSFCASEVYEIPR